MGDAAGHLAESPEAFLAHDGFLGLTEFVIGLFEIGVKLGLMSRQSELLAEHPQEFVIAGREGMGRFSGHQEQSKPLLLDEERDRDGGIEGGAGERSERSPGILGEIGRVIEARIGWIEAGDRGGF